MSGEEQKDLKITKEQWMTLLRDRNVIKEQDIELLTLFYSYDGYNARASQLAYNLISLTWFDQQSGLAIG